jgi:EAL domain-containing protein (putative c-di-GMP-specific phosphodiesterase class I)
VRTLLIDDDPFALKVLERQLRQQGCTDIVAHQSARSALMALEQPGAEVGLLFCDLQMPDIDGVEFVRHLARIGYRGGLALVSSEDQRILQTVSTLAQAHGIRVLGACRKPVASIELARILALDATAPAQCTRAAVPDLPAEELRRAIAAGELRNHYQPKVDMASGALVGAEALVRWHHPALGMVYPDRFIGTAERHGLIDALTHAVLASALEQASTWRRAGLNIQVAVNVSMDNLSALDFPDVVADAVTAAGAPAHSLVLEVTESRLMENPRAALDILSRLRLKRIGLSIDDFGTGHSSLAQLRDIPFNELKLDRSFVHGADADVARKTIVKAALQMAHQLGMKVVAEGVEDQADWDLLHALGCDVAQGYYIAKPMPGEELPAWQQDWSARRGRALAGRARPTVPAADDEIQNKLPPRQLLSREEIEMLFALPASEAQDCP